MMILQPSSPAGNRIVADGLRDAERKHVFALMLRNFTAIAERDGKANISQSDLLGWAESLSQSPTLATPKDQRLVGRYQSFVRQLSKTDWLRMSGDGVLGRLEIQAAQTLPGHSSVLSTIRKVNDHWIANNNNPANWPGGARGWARSTYHIGNLAAFEATGDDAYKLHTQQQARQFNGRINNGTFSGNPDAHAIGQVYLNLGGPRTNIADVKRQTDELIRRDLYKNWRWVDTIFMQADNLAQLGNIYGNTPVNYHGFLLKMFDHAAKPSTQGGLGLFDEATGLWWRDQRFKADLKSPTGKPVLWSRGNGWAFAGLAKILETLPKNAPGYNRYRDTFVKMAQALVQRQRADGFWNMNLADRAHLPGPETSGTASFAYGMAVGIRLGVLQAPAYLASVTRAWNGMTRIAVQPNGHLGYSQRGGDRPSPTTRGMTNDFTVGLFLLAASEISKITPAQRRPAARVVRASQ